MLKLMVDGVRSSLYELDKTCFTKDYTDVATSTITNTTTKGVLGGTVAGYGTASYTVVPCTNVIRPAGLFLNDAAGAAFDNNHAVASNKIAIVRQQASVEVDVYETKSAAEGNAALTYAVGDKLYASANGLLTKEASTDGTVIGIVTKVPTTASPFLGLDMVI